MTQQNGSEEHLHVATQAHPEQVVCKLREADRLLGEGMELPEVFKALEVSEQTFYRWRIQFGEMKADEVKRLKELETENAGLKRIVADQALNFAALNEVSEGRMEVQVLAGCGCAGGPRVTLPVGDCLFVGGLGVFGDLAFGDAALFAVERVAVAAGGAAGVSGFELDRADLLAIAVGRV